MYAGGEFTTPPLLFSGAQLVLNVDTSAAGSVLVGILDAAGAPLCLPPKQLGTGIRYLAGGTIFGLGWALTGACPGPLVALVGAGVPAMIVVVCAALAGTWTYAWLRPRLPH